MSSLALSSRAGPRLFRIEARTGQRITDLDAWFCLAPPTHPERQWQENRSALELARRWLGGGIPPEVRAVLDSRPQTANFEVEVAYAERLTDLDERGEGRHHDLLLCGRRRHDRIVVGIEGKVEESFGAIVAGETRSAQRRAAKRSGTTRLPERLWELEKALFPPNAVVDDLRYQLITATAGTLAEARLYKARRAVFLVHEFVFPGTEDARRRNQTDLDLFVRRLAGDPTVTVGAGSLVGPIRVPGGSGAVPSGIELFIGKATLSANLT